MSFQITTIPHEVRNLFKGFSYIIASCSICFWFVLQGHCRYKLLNPVVYENLQSVHFSWEASFMQFIQKSKMKLGYIFGICGVAEAQKYFWNSYKGYTLDGSASSTLYWIYSETFHLLAYHLAWFLSDDPSNGLIDIFFRTFG